MKKAYIAGIIIGIILFLLFVGTTKMQAKGGPHGPTPSVSPSPSISPSPSPSPSPLPIELPEVVVEAGLSGTGVGDGLSDGRSDGKGNWTNPSCDGIYTDSPLLLHFVRISPTSYEIGWWKPVSGVDKYSLIYGYYGEAMKYGVADIGSHVTRFTIGGLRAGIKIHAQLWAWRGQCVTRDVVR